MSKLELDKIKAFDTGNYGLRLDEAEAFYSLRNGPDGILKSLVCAYNYGFMRGQRSMVNKAKKNKKMEDSL